MAEVVWTNPAFEDLRQLHQFIARDSKQYANITVRKIRTAAERLEEFPESGRLVPEFSGDWYREVLVGQYRLVYRYLEKKHVVLVLAVVHGSRLLPPIVENR